MARRTLAGTPAEDPRVKFSLHAAPEEPRQHARGERGSDTRRRLTAHAEEPAARAAGRTAHAPFCWAPPLFLRAGERRLRFLALPPRPRRCHGNPGATAGHWQRGLRGVLCKTGVGDRGRSWSFQETPSTRQRRGQAWAIAGISSGWASSST